MCVCIFRVQHLCSALLLIYFVHTLIYKYTELPVILICFCRFLNYLSFVAYIYIYQCFDVYKWWNSGSSCCFSILALYWLNALFLFLPKILTSFTLSSPSSNAKFSWRKPAERHQYCGAWPAQCHSHQQRCHTHRPQLHAEGLRCPRPAVREPVPCPGTWTPST